MWSVVNQSVITGKNKRRKRKGGRREENKKEREEDGWDDPHGPCKRKGSVSVVIVA